jgi:hypothetical protein
VAVGKIGTRELAEDVLRREKGDLVGMARALLADPDLPKKWRTDRQDSVVRCVYGNVCKALDENFKRVDCTLWPKKLGQAPTSDDVTPPTWPAEGAGLTAEYKEGRVLLRWRAASDNEAMYGYEVFRQEGTSPFRHASSVRAGSQRFEDGGVVPGTSYGYFLRPYDLAGNRGLPSDVAHVDAPDDHRAPDRDPKVAADPAQLEGCAAAGH